MGVVEDVPRFLRLPPEEGAMHSSSISYAACATVYQLALSEIAIPEREAMLTAQSPSADGYVLVSAAHFWSLRRRDGRKAW